MRRFASFVSHFKDEDEEKKTLDCSLKPLSLV